MSDPVTGSIGTGMLKPADAPQCVVDRDITVTLTRTSAVTTGHDVKIAVSVDVGHFHTGHAIRSERANMVSVPRIVNVFRLFKPG